LIFYFNKDKGMNNIPQEVFITVLEYYGIGYIKNIIFINKSIYNSVNYFIKLNFKIKYGTICKFITNPNLFNYVSKYELSDCIICESDYYGCSNNKCSVCYEYDGMCKYIIDNCYICNNLICGRCKNYSKCFLCDKQICNDCVLRGLFGIRLCKNCK